jgi:hypothetical protein
VPWMRCQAITENGYGTTESFQSRILKVERRGCSSKVISSHIAEAIQYRSLDRDGWLG